MIDPRHLAPLHAHHDHAGEHIAPAIAHFDAEPDRSHRQEYLAHVDGPELATPSFTGPDHVVFTTDKDKRFEVRPYHRALSSDEQIHGYYPLAGWAEMAYQGLAHAGGLAHAVLPVHVGSHHTENGPVPYYAVASDDVRSAPIARMHHEEWLDEPTELQQQATKIGFLDFLSGNIHRNEQNLYYDPIPGAPPKVLAAKGHAGAFQYKLDTNRDHLFSYLVDPLGMVARNGVHPWDAAPVEHAVAWWAKNGRAIRDELDFHTEHLHPEVRAHIGRNFDERAEALDRFSRIWDTLKDPNQYSPYADDARGSGVAQVRVHPHTPVTPFGYVEPVKKSELAILETLQKMAVRDVTQHPGFQEWFQGSRVATPEGKPLVVFHGTSKDKDFKSFKVGQRGSWFTANPDHASTYATSNDSQDWKLNRDSLQYEAKNTSPRVFPVYLSIRNPYKMTAADHVAHSGAKNYVHFQRDLFMRARSQGHDGVDFGNGTWVAFHPHQIKSVHASAFDRTSPQLIKADTASPAVSELPLEPGTAPLKPGHVRLYHQTDAANLEGIRQHGLLLSQAKGIEGPRAIYAAKEPFYGSADVHPTVEFQVPEAEFHGHFVTGSRRERVPPSDFIAIHEPWHGNARYMEEHEDVRRAVLSGQHDGMLDWPTQGPALRYIKQKYGGLKKSEDLGEQGPKGAWHEVARKLSEGYKVTEPHVRAEAKAAKLDPFLWRENERGTATWHSGWCHANALALQSHFGSKVELHNLVTTHPETGEADPQHVAVFVPEAQRYLEPHGLMARDEILHHYLSDYFVTGENPRIEPYDPKYTPGYFKPGHDEKLKGIILRHLRPYLPE